MASAVLARFATIVAPLLVIPLMLGYLGKELFGLWATAASISALAAFADLGLGNGLLTRLSTSAARQDWKRAQQLIANAYAVSAAFCLTLGAIAALALTFLDPRNIVGAASTVDAAEARVVVMVCISAFLVTVPLSLIQRVQYALQLGWQSNAWQTVGGGLMLVFVFAAVKAELSPTIVIAGAVLAGPLAILANSIYFFVRQHPELGPLGVRLDSDVFVDIFRLGFAFFCLSILTSIALNIDNFLIAHTIGLSAVTDYSVAFRLFSMLGFLVTLVALPLWPANSEALELGDTDWVAHFTFRIAVCSFLVVLVCGALMVGFRSQIFSLWLGPDHAVAFSVAAGLTFWALLLSVASPFFSVQNSVGKLKYQYFGWSAYLVVSVALKLFMLPTMGIAAVPIAASIAYAAILLPTAILGYQSTIRSQRKKHEHSHHPSAT